MVMIQKSYKSSEIRNRTRKIASIHFLYVLVLSAQIIVFDAGKLINPETVLQRWIATGLLLLVTTIVWYISRNRSGESATSKKLIGMLILADIAMASYSVYISRGMASKAVLLFVIPIIVSCVLARKSALIATAVLSIAAYVVTSVAYFVLNFNEGYKIELYGEIGFYSALFVVIALLLWVFIRPNKKIS
ncbi:MAG: hypothetical protein QG628_929 [Patescibacteria group bacterium]|nr:hypothetical protein [Patescibacteria group bacterium]